MLVDSPQATDAAVKHTAQTRKSLFRPNWSLIRPASGSMMIWPRL